MATAARQSPTTDTAPDVMSGPIVTDDAELRGMTRFSRRVVKVTFEMEDGREVTIELPTVGTAADAGQELTTMQRDILDTVEDMPVGEVWDTAEIVRRAGHLGPSGQANGKQRSFISGLEPRFIRRTSRGWQRV